MGQMHGEEKPLGSVDPYKILGKRWRYRNTLSFIIHSLSCPSQIVTCSVSVTGTEHMLLPSKKAFQLTVTFGEGLQVG